MNKKNTINSYLIITFFFDTNSNEPETPISDKVLWNMQKFKAVYLAEILTAITPLIFNYSFCIN